MMISILYKLRVKRNRLSRRLWDDESILRWLDALYHFLCRDDWPWDIVSGDALLIMGDVRHTLIQLDDEEQINDFCLIFLLYRRNSLNTKFYRHQLTRNLMMETTFIYLFFFQSIKHVAPLPGFFFFLILICMFGNAGNDSFPNNFLCWIFFFWILLMIWTNIGQIKRIILDIE